MITATELKGCIAVQKVELRALELGFICSTPSVTCRYDRIIDTGMRLYRVQIKYAGELKAGPGRANGVALAGLESWVGTGRKTLLYTADEIDALIIYVAPADRLVWLNPALFEGRAKIGIRYLPSKNNQEKRCLFIEDYLW